MAIESYAQIKVGVGADVQTGVIGRDAGGGLEVHKPLNPPSAWTQFKAAMSNVPLLGRLGSLQSARAEVAAYPVRLGEYQASNRQILAGLRDDLRAAYGSEIADLTIGNLGLADGAPLSKQTVTTAIDGAQRMQQSRKSQNNQQVMRFLDAPMLGGAKLRGEKDMNDVFLDRGGRVKGDGSGWQAAVGKGGEKFIARFVQARCQQFPEHATGRLSNAQVVQAAKEAFDLFDAVSALPGMTAERRDALMEKGSVDELKAMVGKEQSRQQVARFLEGPLPGGVGPGGAKCFAKFVQARCEQFPDYSKGRLSEEQLSLAAKEAMELHQEIAALPGMTPERLEAIMEKGSTGSKVAEIRAQAREAALMPELSRVASHKDGSLMRGEADRLAREHGVPTIPEAVLKSIGGSMDELVRTQLPTVPQALGCPPDATSVLNATKARLEENIHMALEEHCKALKMIDASPTLSEAQKAKLREVAQTRRMDPVQVAEFEKAAAKMKDVFAAARGLPGSAGEMAGALKSALKQLGSGIQAMGEHGNKFWESSSVTSAQGKTDVFRLMAELAAAGMTTDEAREVFTAMSGQGMEQFMLAVRNSGEEAMEAQARYGLDGLMIALGKRAGGAEVTVEGMAREALRTKPGDPAALPPGVLDAVRTAAATWMDP